MYELLPAKDTESLTAWNEIYVELIGTYTILDKSRKPDNKILMIEL